VIPELTQAYHHHLDTTRKRKKYVLKKIALIRSIEYGVVAATGCGEGVESIKLLQLTLSASSWHG
jgi:hypothetical protein